MGNSLPHYRCRGSAETRRAITAPDVPLDGHITSTKVQLRCARCARTSTFDRPQWFSAWELAQQKRTREENRAVTWVQNPHTRPAQLDAIDLPRCPCGEQYIAYTDSRGEQLTSAFPKRKAPVLPGVTAVEET